MTGVTPDPSVTTPPFRLRGLTMYIIVVTLVLLLSARTIMWFESDSVGIYGTYRIFSSCPLTKTGISYTYIDLYSYIAIIPCRDYS